MAENAKEAGLRLLRERIERLNACLQASSTDKGLLTPHVIIASQVVMIMKATMLYCPETMGKVLMEDMRDSVHRECNFCIDCGKLIDYNDIKRFKSAFSDRCPECRNKIEKGLLIDEINHDGQEGTTATN